MHIGSGILLLLDDCQDYIKTNSRQHKANRHTPKYKHELKQSAYNGLKLLKPRDVYISLAHVDLRLAKARRCGPFIT